MLVSDGRSANGGRLWRTGAVWGGLIPTQLGFDGSQAYGRTAQQAGHVIAQVGSLFDNSLLSQDFEQVVSAGQEDLRQR